MPLTTEQKNCEECLGCTRVSVPTVITTPGCYYVTRNISTAAGPVITIRANDVSLDVKGHTLDQSAHSAPVILIEPGSTGIAIFNGTLTGGKPAVSLQSTGPKSRLHFRNLTVKDYRFCGFHLTGLDQLDLVDCRVISGSDHGVMAFASSTIGQGAFSGHFLGNTLRCANTNVLLLQDVRGAIIRGNHMTGEADGFGIFVDGPANLIEGNTVASVHGTGIDVRKNGSLIAGNTVNAAGNTGIVIHSDDNRIVGNVVQNCNGGGIKIGGQRNLIEGNQASQQLSGAGLDFAAGPANAYRNNMLRGNPGGAVSDPFANTDAGGNIV